ncbi:HTH domain-containing protein [Rhodococcus sp. KB6]|uniref:HTH domain-containing protein n=1 Tax=Rhodococcus sp. KB6 TaxID=1752066 RepID=UPI0012E35E57
MCGHKFARSSLRFGRRFPRRTVRGEQIRPLQVLSLLSSGSKTSAIASAIEVSPRTVARDIALLQSVFEADSRSIISRNAAYVNLV